MQVRSFRQQALAFAVAAAFPPCVLAQALPTGGEVRPEQASIFQTSPTSLHIQQHADKAILNWQSFSIGAGAQVNFQQPSSSSIALNRVLGNNPSQIFGHLGANGRVFLVNPSGIFFAPGSSVNVGALVASTLSITDDDFMAGRYVFSNAGGAGSILNQGNLFSHSGYTALLAPQVTNEGFIFANLGSVALAAGDRVTLDMVGDNLIRVSVDQAALNAALVNHGSVEAAGGQVLLRAHSANALLDTVLNTDGYVRASTLVERNGEIILDGGSRGHVIAGGDLSAPRVAIAAGDGLALDATVNTDALDVAVAGDALVSANVFAQGPIDFRGGPGSDLVFSGNNFFSFGPLSIATGGNVSFIADASRNALVTSRGGQAITARSLALTARDGGGASVVNDLGGDQVITLTGGNLDLEVLSGGGFVQLLNVGPGSQLVSLSGGDNAIRVASRGSDTVFASAALNSLGTQRINAGSLTISAAEGGSAGVNADGLGGDSADQQVITLAGGDLNITAHQGAYHAGIGSWAPGGQSVIVLDGGSVNVSAESGTAAISANTGNQTLSVSGGGSLDLSSAGTSARVEVSSFSGDQTISVRGGDHIGIDAAQGDVSLLAVVGAQSISITGSETNAMAIGSNGATGRVSINGARQDFLAGAGQENGSITVIGADAVDKFTQIVSNSFAPGEVSQSISTSGMLRLVGGARPGGAAFLTGFVHTGPGAQNIKAGRMELQGGTGGAGNVTSIISIGGGSQTVDVAGDLVLLGGTGGLTELFSSGPQQINAANILLRGGSGGANNGAFISTNPGVSQHIEVPGQIVLVAGDSNNGAGIIGRGIQTIVGRPDIRMAGGAGGNATIQGLGGLQRIEAHDIFLTNAESSPVNSAGVILGSLQRIDATGDVTLVARSGTGTSSGVRIGAAGAGATDLVLTVDGNVVLTGGTSGTNGAGLGGAGSGPTSDNNVTVIAQGDVILDGALGGAGARIGSSALTPVQEGNISVTARNIRFTGTAPAAIRSLGNVELHAEQAGGTITQDANGFILADALATTSSGSTSLAGENQVSSFNGTSWFGDVTLNNAGALEVTGMSAANASLTNAGPVTISGWWNSFGDTSIATSGAGSDLLVTNSVFAGGAMNVDVAGSLAVIATGGAGASLESMGHQSVAVSGGNIEVLAQGGFAGIVGGSQGISIVDGDYIRIVGDADGFAQVLSPNGSQALSLTGSGDNAIIVGRQGGSGFSTLNAATQDITAGLGGQSGSITILGPDAGMAPFATIAARGEGGQTVSSSGKISVIGGSASFGIGATGFFNDGPGQQTVRAGSIELRGGPAGTGPGVFMNSNGGGDQIIDVSGDIDVIGGTGRNASISVNPLFSTRQAKQTIGAANIRIAAGLGANAAIASSAGGDQLITLSGDLEIAGAPSGIAIINSVGGDGLQAISARSIDISNAGGSGNSVGVIQGSHQRITASGNVTLTAGSAQGELAAARIGSPTDRATDLELVVGGDLVLTGGTAGLNGAALGGSVLGAVLDNDITVNAAGELVLDGGTGGAGVRIGSSERIGLGGGDISITARNIHFVGSEPAAIRTLGNVALNAGEIRQAPNGVILANALTTSSEGSTLLTGSNNVSSFSGSAGGDLLLRNLSSFLTLGPIGASGALGIDQAGSLLIQATDAPLVVRGGLVNVATGGDFRLLGGDADGAHALLSSGGNIDLTVGGTLRLDEGAGKFSWAKVQTESRDGVISLSFPNLSSGGFYVNGVEGDTKDGKSGFFIVHRPAKIGQDLLLDYQE